MKQYSLGEIRSVPLKNRWLAAFLTWLCPGLGHFYQGRKVKAVIFFCSIFPLIAAGLWMGSYWDNGIPAGTALASNSSAAVSAVPSDSDSSRHLCFAKDAYYQWEPGAKRFFFIPQSLNAVIAVPAVIQAKMVQGGDPPLWHGAFAPPASPSYPSNEKSSVRPAMNTILLRLHSWFEMGSIFLAAAGLLNLLVIFDALCGPAWLIPDELKKTLEEETAA